VLVRQPPAKANFTIFFFKNKLFARVVVAGRLKKTVQLGRFVNALRVVGKRKWKRTRKKGREEKAHSHAHKIT